MKYRVQITLCEDKAGTIEVEVESDQNYGVEVEVEVEDNSGYSFADLERLDKVEK